ncbi:MAG TPA: baseplate assembly protein [Nannocystis exedens]|nr:baseplate assembly protein [Nannocystis exedens]
MNQDHYEQTVRDLLEIVRSRHFGKYRGVVASGDPDPTRRGRVEVRVPAILGEQIVWAMPCVPFAGKGVGFHMLPPPGAGIWVEFEAGDPSYPIWSGCYWAAGDIELADSRPAIKFIRTDKLTLRIDDERGELVIETNTGSRFTISALEIEQRAVTISAISKTKNTKLSPKSLSVHRGATEIF